MTDARIPDHCAWAARGRWREAYDAAEAELRKVTAERDSLLTGHRTLNIDGARLQNRAEAAEAEVATLTAQWDEHDAAWSERVGVLTAEVATLRAELDAARGRVKPLNWREARISDKWERWTADVIFGSYEIMEYSNGGFGWNVSFCDEEAESLQYPAASIEAAKSAAQVDYTYRILAAIKPDPAVVRMREALIEHNDLLRSTFAIAEREGVKGMVASTNWDAFYNRVAVLLKRHHALANEARAALQEG